MPIPIPTVHMSLGVATSLVSVPLALNWIPRNRYYGIRTRQALASDRNWYLLNARIGRLLLGFGVFLAGFGYLTRHLAPAPVSLWAPLFFLSPLPPLAVILLLIKTWSHRLPEQ